MKLSDLPTDAEFIIVVGPSIDSGRRKCSAKLHLPRMGKTLYTDLHADGDAQCGEVINLLATLLANAGKPA